GHDLGRVVGRFQVSFKGEDHAVDGAAAAPVEVGIGPAAVGVAEREHVGVGEIDPAVTVGVGVDDVADLRDAAADFDLLNADHVGIGGDRIGRHWRRLVSGVCTYRAGSGGDRDGVHRHVRGSLPV